MVRLNEEEQNWLRDNYPMLTYDKEKSIIHGPFFINHRYESKPIIKATFEIEVRLWRMKNRNEYPIVYNPDNKIKKIAQRKQIFHGDLHINVDGTLCLGLPEKFSEYYPHGFQLQSFVSNLSSFFYWVAYYERHNEAPWPAERHGDDARIEYYIEIGDIESIRKMYKSKLGIGIAKSKLRNYLKSEPLRRMLIKRLLNHE